MEKDAVRNEGTIITKKGMQLISKLLASGSTLNFTKVEIGSGHADEGTDLESLTRLVSYVRDGHIAKCFPLPEKNIASVVCQISSIGTINGFVATEAGLYAEDPDEGEILYAYLDMWDDPQYIYAESNAISKFFEITMSVVISKVENVTAAISPYSMISREEFNELLEQISKMGKTTINTAEAEFEENEIRLIVNEMPY
ncbi:MAG: phage tail protein [Lachnospiraceae bacterium]|nr:phage tail protein [Lachnospiraceae bacterium]